MSDTRRPGHTAKLKSNAESPASNKLTLREGTPEEFTVLLRVPRGSEGRKKTAELIPFMKHMRTFMNADGEVQTGVEQFFSFMNIAGELWANGEFETEVLPFVLGLESDDKNLETLSMMEAFTAFMAGLSYIMAGVDAPEVAEAEKK